MTVKYRLGKKEDCEKIAQLINLASGGIVGYLFHDLVPGMSPVQAVARNLAKDIYPHSYRSAVVAMDGNTVVGMALSFPSAYHKITEEMRGFFPANRIKHLFDFYSSRVENTWFLDALCVFESHRRRGIGSRLISLTKERAVENGYNALSLIVLADNALAIPVYKRAKFEIIQNVELGANEFIKHEEGCLLMKCDITT